MASTKLRSKTVRQSVTIPATLAKEVRKVAKQRHLTMSRALVVLAERGIQAEAEAKQRLEAAYHRFVGGSQGEKNDAARELIRSIFGDGSIADDSVL